LGRYEQIESVLEEQATLYEKNIYQISNRLLTQQEIGVIPRSGNIKHMKENREIFDFEIEDLEIVWKICNTDELFISDNIDEKNSNDFKDEL